MPITNRSLPVVPTARDSSAPSLAARSASWGALTVALALATGLCAVPASAQVDQQDTLAFDPAVTLGTLENGLRYYIRANQRPEERAELRLVINVGSMLETDAQRGVAHFVEHMAFNGTRNFPKQELVAYLESIGMRFGADINAYTTFDETVYMLQVPTDSGTYLERGFEILEDWAHGQTFDPTEVDKERGVVIEEWRLGQGAGSRLSEKILPVLLRGSRYADRIPIGTLNILESVDAEALQAFYSEWYRPDLMAVVAVGDFDVATVEALIRDRFSGIARPRSALDRPTYDVPDHQETLTAIATDPEAPATSVGVYYKLPATSLKSRADYRRDIIGRLHARMLNTRLAELAQQADPPFIGASGSIGSIFGVKDAYSIGASVPDDGVQRGLEAVLTEAERVTRYGFTVTEFEREKASMLRSYEQAFAERERTQSGNYAGEYTEHFLRGVAAPGIAAEYQMTQDLLPGISLDEVNGMTSQWMIDHSRVIVVQAPERPDVMVPDAATLLATFDRVANAPIEAYTDDATDGVLVTDIPAPGNVESETLIDGVGITEWQLSNGVRVLLKPTDFQADQVLLAGTSPGGSSLSPDSMLISANLAVTAVSAGGVADMSAVQLGKALADKAVGVQPGISDFSESITGQASPQDLETLFQLVYLFFTAPRRDDEAVQSLRERASVMIAQSQADPMTPYRDTLTVTMAQHHPRVRLLTPETLNEWDLDESLAVYRDRFGDASDFTFVIVGNFDTEMIRPLVEQWLGALPSLDRTEAGIDHGVRPPDGVIEKTVRRGLEPKAETSIVFAGPFEYTRENRFVLGALSAVLDVKLRDLLREELSGTYGASVSAGAATIPWQSYRFTVSFGSAPERADELTAAVFDEIARIQSEGVDSTTLANVKEAQRRSYETNLRQNGWWLSQIVTSAQLGTDVHDLLGFMDLVDGLTSEMVQEIARTYLPADRYVRVSLLPEAGG